MIIHRKPSSLLTPSKSYPALPSCSISWKSRTEPRRHPWRSTSSTLLIMASTPFCVTYINWPPSLFRYPQPSTIQTNVRLSRASKHHLVGSSISPCRVYRCRTWLAAVTVTWGRTRRCTTWRSCCNIWRPASDTCITNCRQSSNNKSPSSRAKTTIAVAIQNALWTWSADYIYIYIYIYAIDEVGKMICL